MNDLDRCENAATQESEERMTLQANLVPSNPGVLRSMHRGDEQTLGMSDERKIPGLRSF